MLSRVVPGSVYLGFVSLSLIVAEALTVSILEIPGIFSKIQTILTTLFYTGVAAFVFGISLVSIVRKPSTVRQK